MVSTCTRLCLVRHGETTWNTERRLQGHLDIELNATGVAQARATARALAGRSFLAAYSSDLRRARLTAEVITATTVLQVTPEPGLRERHYGLFQGLTYQEAQTRHPTDYARFISREADFAFSGGGESLRAFADRISDTLSRIANRHRGEDILIVTHGGVLDIVHRLATGKALEAPRDFTIPNAALNWVDHDRGRWQLVSWGDQSHLDDARDELANA